jgi:hypothetical protein
MVVRILAAAIFILGLVGIVFGAMFFPQAASGRSEVEAAVAPVPLDQVNAKFDDVSAKYTQMMAVIEPAIKTNKATASDMDMYNYLGQHRALLLLSSLWVSSASA